MNYQNDDLRIKEIKELLPPVALLEKFPATENAAHPPHILIFQITAVTPAQHHH